MAWMQQNEATQIYLTNLINLYRKKRSYLLLIRRTRWFFFANIWVIPRRIELNQVHFKVNKVLFELLFIFWLQIKAKKFNEHASLTEQIRMEGGQTGYLWPTLINIEEKVSNYLWIVRRCVCVYVVNTCLECGRWSMIRKQTTK